MEDLRIRPSTYEFWGGYNSTHNRYPCACFWTPFSPSPIRLWTRLSQSGQSNRHDSARTVRLDCGSKKQWPKGATIAKLTSATGGPGEQRGRSLWVGHQLGRWEELQRREVWSEKRGPVKTQARSPRLALHNKDANSFCPGALCSLHTPAV